MLLLQRREVLKLSCFYWRFETVLTYIFGSWSDLDLADFSSGNVVGSSGADRILEGFFIN